MSARCSKTAIDLGARMGEGDLGISWPLNTVVHWVKCLPQGHEVVRHRHLVGEGMRFK